MGEERHVAAGPRGSGLVLPRSGTRMRKANLRIARPGKNVFIREADSRSRLHSRHGERVERSRGSHVDRVRHRGLRLGHDRVAGRGVGVLPGSGVLGGAETGQEATRFVGGKFRGRKSPQRSTASSVHRHESLRSLNMYIIEAIKKEFNYSESILVPFIELVGLFKPKIDNRRQSQG